MKVKNRRCIRTLSFRQLKASKSRNLIAVFAIALTTLLFTSLFTIALSINDGFQQSNFRQCGGWNHGSFKYLTEEQFDQIKTDPLIQEWGLRRFVGMPDDIPFTRTLHRRTGCTATPSKALCRKREPTRLPPTPACWSCWG